MSHIEVPPEFSQHATEIKDNAFREVFQRKHLVLDPEHWLYGLANHLVGGAILVMISADPENIKLLLEDRLSLKEGQTKEGQKPLISLESERLVQFAIASARSASKNTGLVAVTATDLLVGISAERGVASRILDQNSLFKAELLEDNKTLIDTLRVKEVDWAIHGIEVTQELPVTESEITS